MLRIDDVSMHYPNGHHALENIELEVASGRIVVVIGGSGCGKSTLLRLIAGLESPTSGQVWVADRPVTGPSKHVGVVFQEPRLMPWLNVIDNVGFGLGHLTEGAAEEVALAALERVGLADFAQALPRELSGGMAQRTALARALVTKPEVLLLDEPFSALDALTRADLQKHVLDLWSADQQTLFVVTHDIDEALILADTILVMEAQPGRIMDRFEVTRDRPRLSTDPEIVAIRQRVLQSLAYRTAVRET